MYANIVIENTRPTYYFYGTHTKRKYYIRS
jgi:hypothetical protein